MKLSSVTALGVPSQYAVQSNVVGPSVSKPPRTPPFPASLAVVLELLVSAFVLGSTMWG